MKRVSVVRGRAFVHLQSPTVAFTSRRCPYPRTIYELLMRYSHGTTIIAFITLFFVLVRRVRRTGVDHLGALNRFSRALSNIGAYSISIIRGKDRARGTSGGALRGNKQKTNDGSSDQHCYPHRPLVPEDADHLPEIDTCKFCIAPDTLLCMPVSQVRPHSLPSPHRWFCFHTRLGNLHRGRRNQHAGSRKPRTGAGRWWW